MTKISLEDRVAIVTGAGRGLGMAHALALAERGAAVVVNDIGGAMDGTGHSAEAAEHVVELIRSNGGTAIADSHSVVDGPAIVDAAVDAFGAVDILVNNAGILHDGAFHNMDQADFDAVIDVHLRGAFAVTNAAYRVMRARGRGRIVNTTSTAGLLGNFGQANYGSAKAGLYGLTRVLALEGANNGVKVNCVAPIAYTRMSAGMDESRQAVYGADRVAPVVVYLASDECELNGEVLSVAGGRVARYFMGLTPGWRADGGTPTAEDVHEHLDQITAEDTYVVLREAHEEIAHLEAPSALGSCGP